MGYELRQYNRRTNSTGANDFMTPITTGDAMRKTIGQDYEVSGINNFKFEDETLKANFEADIPYYFHGKIKRMQSTQTFYIRLVNGETTSSEDYQEQYIKTIEVEKSGTTSEIPDDYKWVDVEFIFVPQITFQYMVFELQRDSTDFTLEKRFPLIAYEELSKINNYLPTLIPDSNSNSVNLIKMGIQSRPGLLMCINKEEIRTSKTGVYELQNGLITVDFFSVCSALKEADYSIDPTKTDVDTMNLAEWMRYMNNKIDEIDKQTNLTNKDREKAKEALKSKSFLGSEKAAREIDGFTLDYLYRT